MNDVFLYITKIVQIALTFAVIIELAALNYDVDELKKIVSGNEEEEEEAGEEPPKGMYS